MAPEDDPRMEEQPTEDEWNKAMSDEKEIERLVARLESKLSDERLMVLLEKENARLRSLLDQARDGLYCQLDEVKACGKCYCCEVDERIRAALEEK